MNIFLTTGTRAFLEKLQTKYATEQLLLMHGEGTSLLLHETTGESLFQAPRRYEVFSSKEEMKEQGIFVFHYIPVTDEGKPVFEHHFVRQADAVANQLGFLAYRLLRPIDSDTYVILTQWERADHFQLWQNSPHYETTHHPKQLKEYADSTTRLFSGSSYLKIYTAEREEEEDPSTES